MKQKKTESKFPAIKHLKMFFTSPTFSKHFLNRTFINIDSRSARCVALAKKKMETQISWRNTRYLV